MPDFLHDGNYIRAVPVGQPRPEYPFRQNGDRVTAGFDQDYWQQMDRWQPEQLGIKFPGDPSYYLIGETAPVEVLAGVGQFTRTWSRIPVQQVVGSSMYVTKPPISGTLPQNFGETVVIQPDSTVGDYNIYQRKEVSGDSGVPATNAFPTGGTYTLTIDGSTTASIDFNDSAADVKSALDALTPVGDRGNVQVTGAYNAIGGFTITFPNHPTSSVDFSSITVSSGSATGVVSTLAQNKSKQQVTINPTTAGQTITGGTYTLTVLGDTTGAIAYNASASTISTAVNALTSVNGNATISIPTDRLNPLAADSSNIWFYIFLDLPTGSATPSLTPTGSGALLVSVTGTLSEGYTLLFTTNSIRSRVITTTAAHGISASDNIFIKIGDDYLEIAAGSFTVTSTTAITFTTNVEDLFTDTDSITEIGRRSSAYSAGAKLVRVKRQTDFYLPGVTPGVSTVDDIPLPTYEGGPSALLEKIFSGSTTCNYEVGELVQWRDSLIYMRTITTLNPTHL